MADSPRGTREIWKGVRRGAGWAVGFGAVVTVGGVVRDGGAGTVRGLLRAGLRGRDRVAELSEQLQDLYAEARYEHESQAGPEAGDRAP